MNQFLIEAYVSKHDGRTRRFYVIADDVQVAVEDFREGRPDAVVRTVWEFVRPGYYGGDYAQGGHLPQALLTEMKPIKEDPA